MKPTKYVTKKTAYNMLSIITDEEVLKALTTQDIERELAKYDCKLCNKITEPEMYELINNIVSTISAMLESQMVDNFDKQVVALVEQCSQEQIEQMYCNYLNKEQIFQVTKRKATPKETHLVLQLQDAIFNRTMQLYIDKLKENNIQFEVIHDSIATRDADDELCTKLLKDAELEANTEILGDRQI